MIRESLAGIATPSGWHYERFDRVVRLSKEAGHPDLEPLSVFLDAGVVPRASREDNHNRLGADMANYLIVRPGDIVFNKLRTWQGGIGVSRYSGIVSPAYYVCRPGRAVEPRYLHYLLRSKPYLSELTRISKWMPPAQFDISWSDLKLLPVLQPPMETQCRIADFLDCETTRIDTLVTRRRRLTELLQERHAARHKAEILRGIDPISGAGAHKLPRTWRSAALNQVARLQRGLDLPEAVRREGPYPIVSSGGISGYHDTYAMLPPGVVTGRYGTVGATFWVDRPYWPLNTTLYVRDFFGNCSKWIYYLLGVLPLDVDQDKSAVTGINRNVIGKLRVPVPPVEEQCRMAAHLDVHCERYTITAAALERQILLLRERRQALITAAVTGEPSIPA